MNWEEDILEQSSKTSKQGHFSNYRMVRPKTPSAQAKDEKKYPTE